MIDIRLLKIDQVDELEHFLVSVFGDESRDLAKDYLKCSFSQDYRKPEFFVALDAGRIIGSAAISEEFFTIETWGISWVAVHEQYRNQGLGEKLVNACCERILERAQKSVTVILATYPAKTGLYDQAGFDHAGQDHAGGSFMLKHLNIQK